MTQTLWVGTRKGLFAVRPDAGRWRMARPLFPGEPVTQFAMAADGSAYAALRLGHFGVKLWKSTAGGSEWKEVAAPAFPPKPGSGPWQDDPTPWTVDQVWGLEARAGWPAVGRVPAGGALHFIRRRCQLATGREPVEPSGAPRMVRRRLRPCGHPFDPDRSARRVARHRGHLLRRCMADPRRRCQLDQHLGRHGRRVHAARAARRPEHPGSASCRPVPRRSRRAVVPAPWRHLPLGRWRHALAVGGASAAQRLRLCRRRAPAGPAARLVRSRPFGCPAHGARRLHGRHRNARRRQDVRRARRGTAAAKMPGTWSTAMPWWPAPMAARWRWARPPAGLWLSEDAGSSWSCVSRDLPPIAVLRFA